MRPGRSPRGALGGLVVALVVLVLSNLLIPTGRVAVAQDEPTATPTVAPTSTPTATPTPLPTFQLQASADLLPEGDLGGDGVVNPGDTIQYTVTLTNAGDASGPVQVVVSYDQTFVSGIANISGGGAAGEGQVVWNLDQVPALGEITLTFQATLKRVFPSGRTQVTGAAIVWAGTIELKRVALPAVEVIGPDLRLVDQVFELVTDVNASGRIDPGDTVRFVLSYSNTGGGPSRDATIVVSYPTNLTREIVSNPGNAMLADGSLSWVIGSVPSDGVVRTVEFAVAFVPDFPAGVTTYDLNVTLNDTAAMLEQKAVSVRVSGPSPVVTTSYEFVTDLGNTGFADTGDRIRATLRYENLGTDAATGLMLTATYDPAIFEVTEFSEGGSHTPESGTLVWTLPSLEPGASGTVTFLATVRTLPAGVQAVSMTATIQSEQTRPAESLLELPIFVPTPTPEATPTPQPMVQETRPAQGTGMLSSAAVAILIGAFLFLSLLSLAFVASRVLPGTPEERAEVDTEAEQAAQRRLVRELIEGVVLTAILFAVMILGLQNTLDRDSVNSIIAGIVGYVAGRVASQR